MSVRLLLLIGALLGTGHVLAEEKGVQPVVSITPDPFVYRAEDKRNPFKPPIDWLAHFSSDLSPVDGSTEPSKRRDVRAKELLESFQMDSLKLVAIVLMKQSGTDAHPSAPSTDEPVAMVEDPEGIGHLVRVGSYMGVNEGRIIQIRDNRIEIEEPAPKMGDPTAVRTTILELHKTEESGRDHVSTKTKD